jgi:transposase InsO family protein
MSVPALLEISPRCRAELRKGLQHPPRPADQDEAAPIPEVDMNTVETLNEIPTAAFAPASIKGYHLEIILDSGAAHCCVPSALVKKLGLVINNRRRLFVKTANGIGTSDGQISLPIKLGGKEFLIHGVNVLPLVDYVLLGNAFLKGRAVLDLRNYIADIDGADPIPLRMEPHPQPRIQISSRPPQREDYHDYSESESDSEGDDEYFLDTFLADAVDLGPKIEGTINPDISKEEFHELSAMLQDFNLWANNLSDLGSYTELKHEILTQDSPPVRQGAYPTTPLKNEIIKKEIDQQLAAGVLRPSKSPWASPVSVIPKKDGGMRMCGDYRRLNAITIRDNYPIPRINDLLDALEGVQWISTLDAFSGYFQIEMKEEDKPKTAIISKFGLFEYNRLPFGLCNAPATFQRAMNNILHDYLGDSVLVYLDDIIIYSKGTLKEHLSHIAKVLATLEKNNIKLKPSKCHFAFQEVEYLGHVISNKGIRPIPEKTLAVKAFKTPKDVPQVKSFLGLSGYYRRYVPNYSRVALPLSKLTRKKVIFLWRQPQQYAFDELKERLCSAPILAYPRYDLPFILQPDASAEALGAVLSQVNEEGEEHPIAYASCTLNSAQKNYTTTERECLAVVWAVEHFAQYLEQSSVVIQTDHAALKQLLTTKRPTGRIARWLYRLSPFNYTIENRPGRQHGNADALSRYPTDGEPYDEVIPFVDTHPVEPEEGVLTPGGLPDPVFQILKTSLEDNAPLPLELSRKERRRINRLKNRCYLEQETIWVDTKRGPRRLLPAAKFHHIMQEHHYAPTAGHGGLHNTVRRIQALYYWPGIYKDVKLALDHCPVCIRQLPPVVRPLHPIRVNGAFERVSIDFIGPLPTTLTGNRYILVAIDHLTKWVEAKALPTDNARVTARFVLEEVICRHGCPEVLQSDRGSHFRNHVLENMTAMLQIRKKLSTAYHPQTNGLVERFNKTLKLLLIRLITQRDDCWDRYLAPALFAYRTMIQASTGSTPFYLTYGRDARHPFDPNEPRVLEQPQWQEALQRRFLAIINVIPNARQHAADLNRAAQEAQRRWHDQGRHFDGQGPIPDGTVVMKLPPPNVLAPFANPKWEGPFIITRSYGNGTYQLRTLAGADLGRINGNQLRELRSFPPRFVQQHAPQLVV